MNSSLATKKMKRERLSFILIFSTLFFITPFGRLQNVILAGVTLPKLLLPIYFFIQLVWMIDRYKLHRRLPIYLLFIFSTTPSFITGSDEYSALVVSLLGYITLFQIVRNASIEAVADFECFIRPYLIGLALVCCLVAAAFFGHDFGSAFGVKMVDSWYGMPIILGGQENPNGFATFFIPALTGAAALFVLSQTRVIKSIYIILYFLFCIFLAFTVSRSAAFGALLGTFVIILSVSYRSSGISTPENSKGITKIIARYFAFICFVIILVAVSFQVGDSFDLIIPEKFIADKVESSTYRWRIIEKATEDYDLWRFVFGKGYGKFKPFPGEVESAHNIFVGVFVEFGFMAFLFFASLIILAIMNFFSAMKRDQNKRSRVIVGFHLGSLVGMLFHGLFHEIYMNLTLWYLLAAAHPIYLATRRAKQASQGDKSNVSLSGKRIGLIAKEGNAW